MGTSQTRERVQVRRITVDEQLADDLIRLTVCPLAEGVEDFFDRDVDWGREREWWVRPSDYARKLGIPSSEKDKWPWAAIAEGQVFLSGEFEIVGERDAPQYFKVSPGRKEFLRIDTFEAYKMGVKRLYSHVLTRR